MAVHLPAGYELLEVISSKGKKTRVSLLKARLSKPFLDGNSEVCVKTFTSHKYTVIREALNEAQSLLAACSKHPSICKMYDCYTESSGDIGYSFGIVMEYFKRGDLEDEIRTRKHSGQYWSEDMLIFLLEQIIEALAVLQNEKICHRDIKPQNIFVASPTRLKLGDFGVSLRELTAASAERTLVGTPIYFSPLCAQAFLAGELRKGSAGVMHDIYKSDVFSLGLTFLRMASLRNIRGLNAGTQGEIDSRVGELLYSSKTQLVLRTMLAMDEGNRPNFVQLAQYLKTVQQFQLEYPIPEAEMDDVEENYADLSAQVHELHSELESFRSSFPSIAKPLPKSPPIHSLSTASCAPCSLQSVQVPSLIGTIEINQHETEEIRPGMDLMQKNPAKTMCLGNLLSTLHAFVCRSATVQV
jgi:serine/threonine protein kinase